MLRAEPLGVFHLALWLFEQDHNGNVIHAVAANVQGGIGRALMDEACFDRAIWPFIPDLFGCHDYRFVVARQFVFELLQISEISDPDP